MYKQNHYNKLLFINTLNLVHLGYRLKLVFARLIELLLGKLADSLVKMHT